MSSDDETKIAIESLNGTEFMGTKISVEASHSKVRPKPGTHSITISSFSLIFFHLISNWMPKFCNICF